MNNRCASCNRETYNMTWKVPIQNGVLCWVCYKKRREGKMPGYRRMSEDEVRGMSEPVEVFVLVDEKDFDQQRYDDTFGSDSSDSGSGE